VHTPPSIRLGWRPGPAMFCCLVVSATSAASLKPRMSSGAPLPIWVTVMAGDDASSSHSCSSAWSRAFSSSPTRWNLLRPCLALEAVAALPLGGVLCLQSSGHLHNSLSYLGVYLRTGVDRVGPPKCHSPPGPSDPQLSVLTEPGWLAAIFSNFLLR
jgi:hypothetical protein